MRVKPSSSMPALWTPHVASSAARSACSADAVWGLAVRGCRGRCRALLSENMATHAADLVPSLPVPQADAWILRLAMGSKARAWESRPDRYFHHVPWHTIRCGKPWKPEAHRRTMRPWVWVGTRQSLTCEWRGPPLPPGEPSSPSSQA